MIRLVADENFNNDIVRRLLRLRPNLDIVRVQDVGLRTADDPVILDWAAREQRILLSHDKRTIPRYAYERIVSGLPMPGVFIVSRDVAARLVIEDIVLLADLSLDGEWENQVRFLPL